MLGDEGDNEFLHDLRVWEVLQFFGDRHEDSYCAMMCTEVRCEDGDEDLITEEHDKALWQAKVKKKMKLSITWPYALMIVCYWRRKEGNLTKICLMKIYTM